MEIRACLVEGLLEQVSCSLQFAALIPLHKLREVSLPDVSNMRPLEKGNAPFVYLEGLFEELILLQKEDL